MRGVLAQGDRSPRPRITPVIALVAAGFAIQSRQFRSDLESAIAIGLKRAKQGESNSTRWCRVWAP
ncbi:MAG: hypothetical protein MH252_05805 [Thermosynechococcaceae cyanobacterium MS004]|nr:hypothetical protein [Thermosynechococcaceae cyanobacterium MS004]